MAKKGKKRYGQRSSSSELRAEEGFSVRVIGTSAELKNQIHALEELTDAEAGVIRSTGEMKGAFRSFYESLDDDTKKGVTEEIGKLVETLGDLGKEFLKSEQGEKMFDGMSEGVKAFGSTATSIVGGVASGFAAGGPVGAAIGGLTGLVKALGGEWLEANKRIEESNADLARAEGDYYDRLMQRKKAATDRAIQQTLQAEKDKIDAQNRALEDQTEILESRRSLAKDQFELGQTRAQASGKDETALKSERIIFENNQAREAIEARKREATTKTAGLEHQRDEAIRERERYRTGGIFGDQSSRFLNADRQVKELEKQLRDAAQSEAKVVEISNDDLSGLQARAEKETIELDQGSRDDLKDQASHLRDELTRRQTKGNLSKEGAGSLADLNKILGDGNVGRNELETLKATLTRLQSSREAADAAMVEGLKTMTAAADSSLKVIDALVKEMDWRSRELENMKSRLKKRDDGRG